MTILKVVYDAKVKIVQKESQILTALRVGDVELAARLQQEVKRIKDMMLREHKLIM